MTNIGKYLIALALVLGALGTFAFFNLTPFRTVVEQETQKVGSVVNSDVPWFTSGLKYGNSNRLYSQTSLVVAVGTDQAVWNNNTGQPVFIPMADVYLNGTSQFEQASSTYSIAVGATSTSIIAEPYTLNWETASSTSDFPDLAVTNLNIATGTPSGVPTTGILFNLIGDNVTYHATSTGNDGVTLVVPSGANLFVKLDSTCHTQGACETATSTNRGFTTITIPFQYYYSSPN